MIYKEVLNEMTEDELRNYVCHLGELNESLESLSNAKGEVIEVFNTLCNSREHMYTCMINFRKKRDDLRKIESELENRYYKQKILQTPFVEEG